jgi:F-type H+-transporting ATPase subunit b
MLIDWFTVAAQIINFLLLVWLLKRFLYKPILRAMDAREKRIAAQLRDAETQKREAEEQSERLHDAREEFEKQKQTLFFQAKAEAEAIRQRLTEQARDETEALRLKWREALREEQKALQSEITSSVQKEIFAILRRALRDLAGTELEQQIVTAFVRRLKELGGNEKEQLESARKPNKPLTIRSAFELPPAMRTEIESVICQALDTQLSVRYEIVPEMLGGIELASDGCKISWSIAGYLSSLEQHLRRLVTQTSVAHEQSE